MARYRVWAEGIGTIQTDRRELADNLAAEFNGVVHDQETEAAWKERQRKEALRRLQRGR